MTQPITVRFDGPDDAIILWDVRGVWNWHDWNLAVQCSVTLRNAIQDRSSVPVVMDMSRSGPLPMGLLTHARHAMSNLGHHDYVIVAGGSGLTQSFVRAFCLLNPSYASKVLMADSLDEAYNLIARYKPK